MFKVQPLTSVRPRVQANVLGLDQTVKKFLFIIDRQLNYLYYRLRLKIIGVLLPQ
jgi:hypothetical protein